MSNNLKWTEKTTFMTKLRNWTETAVKSDLNIVLWLLSPPPRLLGCYDVPWVCKTCCSLKVCANRSYYTHSSPPRPFTHKHSLPFLPPTFFLSFSFSLSLSLISSVLNLVNSGQECPDKLVKMTSNSPRRRQNRSNLPAHAVHSDEWTDRKRGVGGRWKNKDE